MGCPFLKPACAGLLGLLKSAFNTKNFICSFLVYLQLFWCNLFFKCVSQPKIAKTSLKLLIWGVWLSMLIALKRLSLVFVIICSLYATVFTLDAPMGYFLRPRSKGTSAHRGTQFCTKNYSPCGRHS